MGACEGIGALGARRCGSDRDTVLCACIILRRKLIIQTVCQTKKMHSCNIDINVAPSESFHLRPSASTVFHYWLGGTGRLMWLHCACVNGSGFAER